MPPLTHERMECAVAPPTALYKRVGGVDSELGPCQGSQRTEVGRCSPRTGLMRERCLDLFGSHARRGRALSASERIT